MRLVVTGRHGQVASALRELADEPDSGLVVQTLARPACDLADPKSIARAFDSMDGDVLVSCAAYTAVDRAESEPDLAMAINAEAPGQLAALAAERGMPIVHLSTDYVFSGNGERPFTEADEPAPRTAYGRSKLAGERAVASGNARHVILRTAWVFSPVGHNFVRTMLRLAAERDVVSVVADQWGNPTSAHDLARGVVRVADRLLRDGKAPCGVFHLVGQQSVNWSGFAEAIVATSRAMGGPGALVRPIPTADYPTPAARPLNSRLATDQIAAAYGLVLPSWRTALPPVVARCLGSDAVRLERAAQNR